MKLTISDPDATKVLARFADKSPAIVEHRLGKGRVWYFAFNPNTDATVDDIHWIRQWQTWLKELAVPLDHDIWRFRIPRKRIPADPTDICLSNNAITIDLSESRDLTRCRLVYSGTLPEVTIEASPNAKTWTRLATIPSNETDSKTVLMPQAALQGKFRHVRFRFAQRKANSQLTLAELDVWGR